MQQAKILWADDEIDLLKPHILFLEEKGYAIKAVSNGHDAIKAAKNEHFDVVFLDENMPGLNGLETLAQIKTLSPQTPVVMITKSEEEHIMEEAIGSKISDYLIKPVKPSQILLSCKRILDNKVLVSQRTQAGYQQEFREISMRMYDKLDAEDWVEIYKKLVHWEMELSGGEDVGMREVLNTQWSEANTDFAKFLMANYLDWLHTEPGEGRPILSPDLMSKKVFPLLDNEGESVFFILLDCMRQDQWKAFEPLLAEFFYIQREENYYSILPTATQYARNAIFAGLHPGEIAQKFPGHWKNDNEEGSKNASEDVFLEAQLQHHRLLLKHSYHKISRNEPGFQLAAQYKNLLKNKLNVIVYNFIDALSHSRTDVRIVRELASSVEAYRSVSTTWMAHSPLLELLKKLSEEKVRIILTTDHGTIQVKKPVQIIGDRETTTNLRYKQGKNLNYDSARYLFEITKPKEAFLPKPSMSSSYVFCSEDYFFAYPNNYNHYVKYYKDTFQHGGISMEEVIVPFVELIPKG